MSTPKGEGVPIPESEIKKYENMEWFKEMSLDDDDKRALTEEIERIVADPERYIDRGGAGAVYRLSKGLCVKLLENRELSPAAHIMDIGNNVAVESAFLRQLSDKIVEQVRVPYCYGYWKSDNPNLPSAIIMEQLDAVNLQHALNGAEALPEAFDLETFTDALYAYLEYLHDEEGIVHGDLYARNIMIDRGTGMPRYIDFGRSKFISGKSPRDRALITKQEMEMCDVIAEALETLDKST